MSEAGVNLTYLRELDGVPTGQAVIYINETKENTVVIVGGANTYYPDDKTLPEEFKAGIDKSTVVLLQKEIPPGINLLAA